MQSLFELERPDLAGLLTPGYRATQVFELAYQQWVGDFALMSNLPKPTRAAYAADFDLSLPPVHKRFQSVDGTVRYLLQLQDSQLAETVFIPEEHRNTICVSSQVGCALGCRFCLTAQLGFIRNLSAGEIVSQVLVAQRDNLPIADKDRFNIVLMGMGEPLHNYDNVMKAVRILHDPHGLNISMSRITLSSAGLLPAIERLALEEAIPNLAISLTGASNAKRDELMPINRKYPIGELLETVRRFPLRHRQRVTFEYVLLEGVTDGIDDARELARLLGGMRAKVNLIPFNEAPELEYRRPSDAVIVGFQAFLSERGVDAFVRRNRGNDISAACGQLRRKWAD